MTSITAIRDFIKWYFSYIPFVTADPADIDKHFSGYNYNEFDGLSRSETSEVYVCLRKNRTSPLSGTIRDAGTAQQELLYVDIYCVKTVGKEDWREQEQAQEDAKQAIADFQQWIYQKVRSAQRCDYPLLKYIDLNQMPQGAVENFGTSNAFGWFIRLNFSEWLPSNVEFTTPPAGPFPLNVAHGSLYYYDSADNRIKPLEQGTAGQVLVSAGADEIPVWTARNKFGYPPITFYTIAGQNEYTAADVPELADMVGLTPKVVAMDSANLTPAFRGWDNTTFSINENITVNGDEYITIIPG